MTHILAEERDIRSEEDGSGLFWSWATLSDMSDAECREEQQRNAWVSLMDVGFYDGLVCLVSDE